jgi:hypothetical protein
MAAQATAMDYAFYAFCGVVVAYLLWEGLSKKEKITPYE